MADQQNNPSRDDYRVRELGNTVLALRSDLTFLPQEAAGQSGYVIEDAINSKYYRLGMAEYHFVSLLDGHRTVREAIAMTATARPDDALTAHDAATLCQWLIDSDLAHTRSSAGAERLTRAAEKASRQRHMGRINPIFIRIPLLRPDGLVKKLRPALDWLYTVPAVAAAGCLALYALYLITTDWQRFVTSTQGIFSPHGYLGVLLCWLLLKVVHEFGHGVACKKYGGFVREAGIVLLLFLPIAYVDVSSSWRFRSKWQRIITAAAGMYIELIMAALAAVVWSLTDSGPLNQLCTNFVLMASLTTVLFNANPLMRFDGYYILSDLLEIPNLYGSGQQFMRRFGRRWFMGVQSPAPPWPKRNAKWITVYAFASLGWRLFICMALLVSAATLFHGAGVVIAVMGLVAWVAVPVYRFGKYVFGEHNLRWSQRGRLLLTSTGVAVAVLLVFAVCPWPFAKRAPALIEFSPLTIVRAASPGFVQEVYVQSGQQVRPGDVLVLLENEQLEIELAELDLEIQQARLTSLGLRSRHEMASYQAEEKRIEGLLKRRAERQAQVEKLAVRAATEGTVMRRQLTTLLGTYLHEGDEILAIGDPASKEVRLSVAQEDVPFFQACLGKTVLVRTDGGERLTAPLSRITPRATLRPPHVSMCATNGGPLVVKQSESASSDLAPEERVELIEPRFTGTIILDDEQSGRLFAGQRGFVHLAEHSESVGGHLYHAFQRWLNQRLAAGQRG